MGRIHDKIFRINEQIRLLMAEEELVAQELSFHRHLHDDAARDAAVTHDWADRADARDTAADVVRFERSLDDLKSRRARLESRRDRLLERLGDL